MSFLELLKSFFDVLPKVEKVETARPYTCPCCGQVVMPEIEEEENDQG